MVRDGLDEYYRKMTKGIRGRTLRRFWLFAFAVRDRFNTISWSEWIARDPRRQDLRRLISNYLVDRDKEEVQYYVYLGFSERTVYDYWNTLLQLVWMFCS